MATSVHVPQRGGGTSEGQITGRREGGGDEVAGGAAIGILAVPGESVD